MKRFLSFVIICCMVSEVIHSQKHADTLFLRNGSIAIGKLNKLRDGQYQIRTSGGMLFVFSTDEVERFSIGGTQKITERSYDLNKINGFGFGITSSLLLGSSDENFPIYGTQNLMIAYAINPEHVISLGTGIELFESLLIPLFIDYRYNISRKNVSPFIYLRGGGLIKIGNQSSDKYNGGWTIGTGTGFRWPIHNFESYIKLGYRYATFSNEGSMYDQYSYQAYPYTRHQYFHRLEMGWGFRF